MLSETESKTLRDETLTTTYSGTPLYFLDLASRDVFISLAKKKKKSGSRSSKCYFFNL